ncbi:SRPBCC family protein [Crocosphaera sp. UHCC 0190]|uniref:SRPBCC family protein n=1 Tax=Crocosphaera sp. UHCC 0190 TaxID=3110246 RepID=UPI002B2139BC|nr:SRPBCC family protein [Crocosphaera sp. UHCC 0190]MEA5508503.1 SRPBCC family protein [Crocosphaera sp. UHCC 0190]
MLTFKRSTLINAPIEKVWEFHERPDILDILTPPWQPVQIIRREGGLGVGAVSEFRLILGIIPIRWIARHTACEKPYFFVDKQEIGPMKSWVHRHQFTDENGKTRLTDEIQYEIPGGIIIEFLIGWWVDSRLQEMFRYRHEITQKELTEQPHP